MADRQVRAIFVGDAANLVQASKQVEGSLRGVEKVADGMGGTLRRVGEIATGFLAANVIQGGAQALAGFVGDSVRAASELEQSIGGVQSIFGENAAEILAWGESADRAAGLSRNAFNELATPLGAMLKNAGFGMDEVTGKTIDLTKRAADMAATFGGPVDQAMGAITAALRGETDPIERYGVALRAADVEARALADTGKATASALTPMELQQARLALLFEQTAASQGQFAKEADTAAGQAERQRAAQENLAAQLGEQLLPLQLKVTEAKLAFVGVLSEHVIPTLTRLAEWIQSSVIPAVQGFWSWISERLAPAFRKLSEEATEELDKLRAYWVSDLKPAIENIWTVVETVVGAVVDFIAERWPQIQQVIEPVLLEVQNQIQTVLDIIKGVIATAIDVITGDWEGAWNNLKGIVETMVESIKETFNNLLTFVTEFGTLLFEGAKDLGKKLVDGIVAGIKAIGGAIGRAIADQIPSSIPLPGPLPNIPLDPRDWMDNGGVVQGPRGAPRLIMAHGGETVLPTHKGVVGAGGGNHYTINVSAPEPQTAADYVLRAITTLENSGRLPRVSVG